jgi:hypothetical protein
VRNIYVFSTEADVTEDWGRRRDLRCAEFETVQAFSPKRIGLARRALPIVGETISKSGEFRLAPINIRSTGVCPPRGYEVKGIIGFGRLGK